MRAREDQDAADVIAGTFSLFNTDMHTLIYILAPLIRLSVLER